MKNTDKIAIKHSLNAFMNSFHRDYGGEGLVFKENGSFIISLKTGEALLAPIVCDSMLGNNGLDGRVFLRGLDGGETELTFESFLDRLISSCFEGINKDLFLDTVFQSLQVMKELLAKTSPKRAASIDEMDYLASEQSLVFGHPFHPYPKAFSGFNPEDRELFLPESAREIKLVWIAVKKQIVYAKNSRHFDKTWSLKLAKKDLDCLSDSVSDEGFLPVPCHPWQWEKLKEREDTQCALAEGDILLLGRGKVPWFATSSTRSLYSPELDCGLKFSLSVKITNSVRHLGENELVRGIQVDHVFNSEHLRGFLDKYKEFKVLREPACVGLLDQSKKPIDASFVLFREGIGNEQTQKQTYLLSTLTQNFQAGQGNLLADHVKKHSLAKNLPFEACAKIWLQSYLEKCVEPLLGLACDYGLLLGAHMQNVLVQIGEYLPEKIYFRDCQGSGFTQEGFDLFSDECTLIKADNGNVLDLEASKSIFLYYLVVNNVFGVVSAIAKRNSLVELRLLSVVKKFLFHFEKNNPKNLKLFHAIYSDEKLFQKGNFRCCVQGHNENTMNDPSSIYNEIENPISTMLRTPKNYESGCLISRKLSCGTEISFSKFDIDVHLEVFHKWHNTPYVSEFWEMAQNKEELKEYVVSLLESPFQLPTIYEVNGVPVGYFEIYWAFDDRIAPYCLPEVYDRGIHLLIGEESYLRTKFVLESINLVSEFIFDDEPKTKRIWAEPRADNTKIRKIGDKLPGWRFVREFDFPHKRAALLCNDKDTFIEELAKWKR